MPRKRKRRDLAIAPFGYCLDEDGLVADQHTDPAVAPELRVAKSAGLDLRSRHSGHDQRVTNDDDATFVGAVDPDAVGRIPIHVVGDLFRLAAVGAEDLVAVGVERVVPVRAPAAVPGHGALGAGRADQALRTSSAGRADWTGDATQLGAALCACISGCALRAGGTGTASRAGRTREARALSARLPGGTLRACGTGRTGVTSTTDHHRARGARRSARALRARRAYRTGRACRTYHRCTGRAGGARRASVADRAGRTVSAGRTDIARSRGLGDRLRGAATCDGE